MSGNSINFDDKKIKKKRSLYNKKIFHIDDIDVNKILVSKKKNMVNIVHLNTLLDIMFRALTNDWLY